MDAHINLTNLTNFADVQQTEDNYGSHDDLQRFYDVEYAHLKNLRSFSNL